MKGSPPRLGQAGLVGVCKSHSAPHPLPLDFIPKPSPARAPEVPGRSDWGSWEHRSLDWGGVRLRSPRQCPGKAGVLWDVRGGMETREDWGLLSKISQRKVSTSFCLASQGCQGCSGSLAGLAGATSPCQAAAAMDHPSWEGPGSIPGWRQDG